MRRSERLIELSREHHDALSLARRLRNAGDSPAELTALAQVVMHEAVTLERHFAEEERSFVVARDGCAEARLLAQLEDEHRQLRDLLAGVRAERNVLMRLGLLLEAHVRFEERELFPALERHWAAQPA